ncbi:MAG TPA: hypothetical protein VFQ70_01460 [Candidatus Saccharimonadaceae bacterium]|nr:hypothetical protein [Candidatus Saccharimonadaceae bacterium]
MHFGTHHIQLSTPDPFDDGLLEEIAAERNAKEAITLEDRPDESTLEAYWDHVEDDIRKDPEWFSFTEEE